MDGDIVTVIRFGHSPERGEGAMRNRDPDAEDIDSESPSSGQASAGQTVGLWSLIDGSVRSGEGTVLGRVADVEVDRASGRVVYVEVTLLERVSPERFGSERMTLAVPWEALRPYEASGFDGADGHLVLSVPPAELDPVPEAGGGGPTDPGLLSLRARRSGSGAGGTPEHRERPTGDRRLGA